MVARKTAQRCRGKFLTRLIDYFDKVGELGDPTEANALLGAPAITLDEWFKMPKDPHQGMPH